MIKFKQIRYLVFASLLISLPIHPTGWLSHNRTKLGIGAAILAICGAIGCNLWSSAQQAKREKRIISSIKPGQPKPWAALETHYRNELNEEESKIMAEFLAALEITQEGWEKRKRELDTQNIPTITQYIEEETKKHSHPLSPVLKQTIITLLQQQGIDIANIHFIRNDDYCHSMAILGGLCINRALFIVNEKECNTMPPKELEWIGKYPLK